MTVPVFFVQRFLHEVGILVETFRVSTVYHSSLVLESLVEV
jgi:hypothetical protein